MVTLPEYESLANFFTRGTHIKRIMPVLEGTRHETHLYLYLDHDPTSRPSTDIQPRYLLFIIPAPTP